MYTPPPKPTRRELEVQIMMGLAESAHRYRHGELSSMQLGSTIRRARHNGMGVIRISQITGLSPSKVLELEQIKYVGGYYHDGAERNTGTTE